MGKDFLVSRFQINFLDYAFLLNNSWDTEDQLWGVGKVCLLGTRQISSALSHGIYTNGGIALRVKGVPWDSRLEMMMGPRMGHMDPWCHESPHSGSLLN